MLRQSCSFDRPGRVSIGLQLMDLDRLSSRIGKKTGVDVDYVAIVFGILGVVAFVRVEKLVKTLKEQGVLDPNYKDE